MRSRNFWNSLLPALFLLAMAAFYSILLSHPYFGMNHDDGLYIANAKSLAEGHGYRNLSLPGEPPQTKYPPVFAGLLSLVWKISPDFPRNLPLLRMVAIAGAILWAFASYRLLALWVSPLASLWIVLLSCVGALSVLITSNSVLPDTWYGFFLTAGLYFAVRAERKSEIQRSVLSGLFFGLAILTRTMGIVPAAAAALAMAWRRQWSNSIAVAGTVCLCYLPWAVWVARQPAPSDPVQRYYTRASYESGHVFTGRLNGAEAASAALSNAGVLLMSPITTIGVRNNLPGSVLLLLMAVCLVSGLIVSLRAGWSAMHAAWILHIGLLVIWLWPPLRYVIPLQVLWFLFVYLGADWYVVRWFPRRRFWIWSAIVLLLCGIEIERAWSVASAVRAYGYPKGRNIDAASWAGIQTMADWIRASTPPDAVIGAEIDPVFYLLTGRKAIRGFVYDPYELFYRDSGSADEAARSQRAMDLRRTLIGNRITHVAILPLNTFAEDIRFRTSVKDIQAGSPGAFEKVAGDEAGRMELLRVNPGELQAGHLLR